MPETAQLPIKPNRLVKSNPIVVSVIQEKNRFTSLEVFQIIQKKIIYSTRREPNINT